MGTDFDPQVLADITRDDPKGLPRWKVSVAVVREVDAQTSIEATDAVCGPIRAAFGGGEVGIADLRCTRL